MDDDGRVPPRAYPAGEGETRAQRASRYDPRRARARLALIEQQVRLACAVREREDVLARMPASVEPGNPLEVARSKEERIIADAERWVRELTPHVGDPEAVVDEEGWLPAERRERYLTEFTAKLGAEASGLRERLPALRAELKATQGRRERAAIREEIGKGTARLAYLEAVPPFTAADMCSECPWPMDWHDTDVTFCLTTGAVLREPCPAWPVWHQQLAAGLLRFVELTRGKEAPAAPPQPLAVIPAGASVEEVIAQLSAIQADHPGARVRRGKRNCWEVWPAPAPD